MPALFVTSHTSGVPVRLPYAALRTGLLLLLLSGLALVLRGYRGDTRPLSGDESFSWRLTQYPASELVQRTGADVHPPLYYLLLQAWERLCGDSPLALRGLSALLGLLAVPVLYAVCRRALALSAGPRAEPSAGFHGGALFAAALLAVHAAQVVPGGNVRMYSLGVLLAGLTAWLLLRALAAPEWLSPWWGAYGLAVAAFCYTHYYAFFTVAAQVLFLGLHLLVRARATSWREVMAPAAGFLFAGILALVLYSPWLRVLGEQAQGVRANYWIGPISLRDTSIIFYSWGTGLDYTGGQAELWLWPLLVALATAWAVWRAGQPAVFFVLQAALPWVLSLGLSLLSGRSIFLDRYLVFAHFFFLGLWAVVWDRLPGLPERLLLALFLGAMSLWGLAGTLARHPDRPPTLAAAAVFLAEQYQTGDVVLTNTPYELNRLRYYLAQAGLRDAQVRCTHDPFSTGHDARFSHIASIARTDIVWDVPRAGLGSPRRVWRGADSPEPSPPLFPNQTQVLRRTFDGGGGSRYTLVLYRQDDAPAE